MKKKFNLALFLIFLLAGSYSFFRERSGSEEVKDSVQNEEVILFVGETCPHCKKVEEWLVQNPSVKEESGVVIKEVYYHQDNAQQLKEKAKECQINTNQGIGVPFLYDRGNCLIGDQPIIDYFSTTYQNQEQ